MKQRFVISIPNFNPNREDIMETNEIIENYNYNT